MDLSKLPSQLKPIGHYLKLAADFEQRDPVISYWCRYHSVQTALSIDKSSPESKGVIIQLLNSLEEKKRSLHDNESISSDAVAEAYIEDYILKLFNHADGEDRSGVFNKNVVKSFYNAGVLIDILANFGEITEEFQEKRRYAKWKAAYIHNCLKSGVAPTPGPPPSGGGGEGGEDEDNGGEVTMNVPPSNSLPSQHDYYNPVPMATPPSSQQQPTTPYQQILPPVAEQPPPKTLDVELIQKASKYTKYATSSLTFDDVPGAIFNLEKALYLLKNGVEMP